MRQLYAFRAPFNTKKDGDLYRPPKINQDRDGWAMHLLVEALRPEFDIVIPGMNTDAPDLAEAPVRRRLHKGDLVLTSTRFGMDDFEDQVKTPVLPGNNWLEGRVIGSWRRYIRHCSRKRIELTEEGAQVVGGGNRHLTTLDFADTDDASFGPRRRKERRTAAYIVCSDQLWDDGPGCLSVFGMSGTVTFGFVSALSERWSSGLRKMRGSELVVAEIVCRGDLVPLAVQAFPDYWRRWIVHIHRAGVRSPLSAEGQK